MNPLGFKPWVPYGILAVAPALLIVKRWLRPLVREADGPQWLEIILGSAPNLLEAFIGVPLVAGFLYFACGLGLIQMRERTVYWVATSLAALYVISQELRFHNLGGNNVYDPNDVIASVIGLVFMLMLGLRVGFFESQLDA